MKLRSTRRPGQAKYARVLVLEVIAEGPDEERELGRLAIDLGAVFVIDSPPKQKPNLTAAIERIKELVKGIPNAR